MTVFAEPGSSLDSSFDLRKSTWPQSEYGEVPHETA
jgi:hypothetical protein